MADSNSIADVRVDANPMEADIFDAAAPQLINATEITHSAHDRPAGGAKKARSGPSAPPARLLGLAGAALAAVLAAAVFRVLRRRRRGGAAELLEPGTALPALPAAGEARPLAGRTLTCSALFDVKGCGSRYSEEEAAPAVTAEAVAVLLRAGALFRGRTLTEELGLGLLGDREAGSNPAAPDRGVSGCSSGVAAAVAGGAADIGLGMDHLSGVRVQSALFGLSGFRPTRGHMPARGCAAVTSSMDVPGWLVRDPQLHVAVAEAFSLPGAVGSFRKTELLQLVVASEAFEAHGPPGARLKRLALAAARRWAGPEQTATGLLVTYLQKNVPAAKAFVGYDGDSDDVLEGVRRAAVTLQYSELLQRHGHLLERPAELQPSVLEQLERAQDVGEEEVAAAEQVAAETERAMRAILVGSVLLLPSLPAPQPGPGAGEQELKAWERGALQLAALAALTGCPQVTLPVPGAAGEPPSGLALLALPKADQTLAHVAAALHPLLQAAASAAPGSGGQQGAAAQPAADAGRAGGGARGAEAQKAEAQKAEQEALRQVGNDAFKAGRFQEAIEQYSLAMQAGPGSGVLHSNRAQALIKVGRFKEAEADCSAALRTGLNAKALLRRGTARAALSDISGALADFRHVLRLEPSNRQARLELQNLKGLSQEGLDDSGLGGMLAGMGPAPPGTARSDLSF